MLRTILASIILLVLMGAGVAFWFATQPKTQNETYFVGVGMVKRSVKGLGRGEGVAEASLSFGRSGRLDEVLVCEGQEVDATDHLAKMNPSEVDAQIAQQAAELKITEAKLDLVQVNRPPE